MGIDLGLRAPQTKSHVILIILSLLGVVLCRWWNNFDTVSFNFSELLALETAISNYVQICQYILIIWDQTRFFHGCTISIYTTHLTYDLCSKKMKMSQMELKIIWSKESYKEN